MANPKFDRDRAAKVLIDAAMMGDVKACEKWEITRQTLHNYRKRLEDDPDLLQVLTQQKTNQDKEWAAEIPTMLSAGIDFLKRAAQEADPRDSDVIHSIAGAVKIVSEVQAMRDVIDARISGQARSDGAENQ